MFVGILAAAAVSAAVGGIIGFGNMIMQADLFDNIASLATTISVLVSTLSGVVIYAITTYRKATKKDLTERDKWIMEGMKAAQIAVQKSAEGIGRSKEVMQIIYDANLTAEQKKAIEARLVPLLQETDTTLQKANEQISMVKGKAVEIFGPEGDVDQDPTVPREAIEISSRLRGAQVASFSSSVSTTSKRDKDAIK
jgi:hypothetical protein